jgi:hypothetical protein
MFERSLDILKAFVSIFKLSSDSQTLKFPLLNSLLNKTKMIEDEYVSQLAERIRRQRIASSWKPVLPLLLHSSSSSSSSFNNQNQNRKLDVLKWRREKELNSKQEKETRMKREQEQTKAAKEKERKDRKARKARISEREEERKRRNSERERNSSLEAMSKSSHKNCSPLEALARRRRDMDFARHRYEMKTKEAKEKEEREARIARAAEKFRPKVFGSSVLRAETICSRERMKARADANEAARAKAESWFLPMNSVIK